VSGRLFPIDGPATGNAQLLTVDSPMDGISRRLECAERKERCLVGLRHEQIDSGMLVLIYVLHSNLEHHSLGQPKPVRLARASEMWSEKLRL